MYAFVAYYIKDCTTCDLYLQDFSKHITKAFSLFFCIYNWIFYFLYKTTVKNSFEFHNNQAFAFTLSNNPDLTLIYFTRCLLYKGMYNL